MTRLFLDRLDIGINGAVVVLLVVVLLAGRRTHRSYCLGRMSIASTDRASCWPVYAIRETVSPVN